MCGNTRYTSYHRVLWPSVQSARRSQRNPQSLHPRSPGVLPSLGSIHRWNIIAKTQAVERACAVGANSDEFPAAARGQPPPVAKSQGAGNAMHCTKSKQSGVPPRKKGQVSPGAMRITERVPLRSWRPSINFDKSLPDEGISCRLTSAWRKFLRFRNRIIFDLFAMVSKRLQRHF